MTIPGVSSPGSLAEIIELQKRGEPYGICSVCSANPFVLESAMWQAQKTGSLLLIESTANQVNQYGGYMGLTPSQFRRSIAALQNRYHLASHQVILGGDHLGPTVWQAEPAEDAMQKSAQMVVEYVRAGYTKIHLDASMPLGGDPPSGPSVETCASRTARLCLAAESAWKELSPGTPRPRYIIGTEVPPPGGEQGNLAELAVTTVESARQTLEATRRAFDQAGLLAVWEQVIALVVQPGVEFGNMTIHPYRREKTKELSQWIAGIPGMVFEAHSTDYQTPQALHQLVEDHFAILKVGPALTFAFREAVFSLESIENELLSGSNPEHLSHLRDVLEEEMLAQPKDWTRYYPGSLAEQRVLRQFSLSDRIRYYWTKPRAVKALEQLVSNLQGLEIPASLVSQYMPSQYARYRQQGLELSPIGLIQDKISEVIRPYQFACDPTISSPEFKCTDRGAYESQFEPYQ